MDKMEEQILEIYHENAVLRTKIDTLEQEIENIKEALNRLPDYLEWRAGFNAHGYID